MAIGKVRLCTASEDNSVASTSGGGRIEQGTCCGLSYKSQSLAVSFFFLFMRVVSLALLHFFILNVAGTVSLKKISSSFLSILTFSNTEKLDFRTKQIPFFP
jgi:hypothetical protein